MKLDILDKHFTTLKVVSNSLKDSENTYADAYLFGYQGSEHDPELLGGSAYTTYFRGLDPRIGRWLSPDVKKLPWQSPYTSMDCNPIALIDPWGAQAGGGDDDPPSGTVKGTGNSEVVRKTGSGTTDDPYMLESSIEVVEILPPPTKMQKFVQAVGDGIKNIATRTINRILEITKKTSSWWKEDISGPLKENQSRAERKQKKQKTQPYGNRLVAPGLDIPGNTNRYEPEAEEYGEDIDISPFLKPRGGGSISGKTGMVIEVIKKSKGFGEAIGDVFNSIFNNEESTPVFDVSTEERVYEENGKIIKEVIHEEIRLDDIINEKNDTTYRCSCGTDCHYEQSKTGNYERVDTKTE